MRIRHWFFAVSAASKAALALSFAACANNKPSEPPPDERIVRFTLGLVIVAALQFIAMAFQAWYMRKGLRIALETVRADLFLGGIGRETMLNKKEMANRLGIHEQTVDRWANHGIIKAHLYNDHGWQLYELPGPNMPAKHSSRWDRLVDQAAGVQTGLQTVGLEAEEV